MKSKTQKELYAIHQASQRLQQLTTPDRLAQEIIALLEDLLNYEFGAVLLIDEDSGKLYPFAISDQGKGPAFIEVDKKYILSHGIKLGKGITGWVAQHGKSICSGDVTKDPRYYSLRTDIHSELCVPMMIKKKVIGVINIETTRANAYTHIDQLVLETVASQIAIAIQNSLMYEEIRNYSSQLEKHVEKLKKTEARLRKELKARQILIKEIHHRVKNNLAVIIAMLKMQARNSKSDNLQEMFSKAINRIHSMAEVHKELYRSKNLSKIDCQEYISKLVEHLAETFDREKKIKINVQADKIYLDINVAIPFGIILNELISNSFNHAFKKQAGGEIYIGFKKKSGEKRELVVQDNGTGIIPQPDIWQVQTVGYKIIAMLVDQIDGKISVNNEAGTVVKIEF